MTDGPVFEVLEAGWTVDTITGRAAVLADSLRARGVPAAELEALAPGGAQNQTADPLGAAVVWYALLRARFALEEERRAGRAREAERAIAAALAAEPVPVQLSAPDAPRAVYPKSFHALQYCDTLDRALRALVGQVEALEAVEVNAWAALTQSLAVRLWAWILTHPAPGLPFDETVGAEPPAWTTALTPEDLLALLEAHVQVHRRRLALIAELFPGDRSVESRLTLAGFLGTVAQELGHRPFDVLRHWSVGEAFAQAVVAAQAAREAMAAAEQRAADRRGAA